MVILERLRGTKDYVLNITWKVRKKLRLGRGFMILRDGIRFFIYAQRIFFAIVLGRSFVPPPYFGLTALYITHNSDEFIVGMSQVNVIEHRCYAGHAQSPSERQRIG